MKILSAQQTRDADAYTIAHEPITSEDLMERASTVFTNWFTEKFKAEHPVKIFCGTGNNGGDGLVVARLLKQRSYNVEVYIVRYAPTPSKDFLLNEQRLRSSSVAVKEIQDGDPFPEIPENTIVIDALWGSGLNRAIEGFPAKLIRHLNDSAAIRVAIDIPSGLFADAKSDSIRFQAHYTLTSEAPKFSFFFPENYAYVGDWEVKSIGLHPGFLKEVKTNLFFVTHDSIKPLIRPRKKFDHKGTFGHALIIGGSYGKIGAALLSAEACLRAGAGLVSAHIPECGYEVFQSRFPEAMVTTDKQKKHISSVPDLKPYKAIGIGPGLGKKADTAKALLKLLKSAKAPLVLDADALNIFAENKAWLKKLPPYSILTPHPGEFERLFGKSKDDYARHELQKQAAQKYQVIVVLKGASTAIAAPDGNVYFNSTGNPGMATGGSGDVLTGIITGLAAQGYAPLHSALIGVYLHGLAGDLAAEAVSQPALVASDIILNLGNAYKTL